mmetsp:Transcript_91357/g.190995  ORF Transcript_91357/g.190995 Transcript_91357/m.190995 type:complete len:891 (-) Transcript_91357:43-2715(-)|eukprot:CAMPEP_0206572510 /NCGR_PEP_ID=MMETSP0325_2-20121206/28298_1 /ASSEMBLY_ACC=CAM_ASM_000347 /TAXON_ID=2866 /ORGANISM="Crypthecodinium cohnii, Strain Seligo" /LENGTH=890 /DNA_ID=CAMNT_0054076747 /DNA_START=53 /DNA_END=2725 /DNA_ORIENTATION=+
MSLILDEAGNPATIGTSISYWLSSSDFVSTSGCQATALGNLGFPREWPEVYSSSKVLKSLIGKKGRCAGKRVGVLVEPLEEEKAAVKGLALDRLSSFLNAERVQKHAGLDIVQGWAIYEHVDLGLSEGFVAQRYWWNMTAEGKWIDFSPWPASQTQLILAEAAGDASKSKSTLTQEEFDIAKSLSKQRFGVELQLLEKEKDKEKDKPSPDAKQPAAGAKPLSGSIQELAQKVEEGRQVSAVSALEEKLRSDEDLAVKVVSDALLKSLAAMLAKESDREDVLRLLIVLTDAGVGLKKVEVANTAIRNGVVGPLSNILSSGLPQQQELAAAILGNLCHESPVNQDKVAGHTAIFKSLVDLLGTVSASNPSDVGPAQEAAYAIWNLTVGHAQNSQTFARLGATQKLGELLKIPSDIAQENAAGALMHLTMSSEARSSISATDTIPRLCKLLEPSFEPEVSTQAAGALLNLASDSPEYAELMVKHGAVEPMVALVKDGPDLAKEYAAGALMNMMKGDPEAAAAAAKAGAVQALAGLLSRPFGTAEALGALANLAGGSPERQIAIYKAQVTRRAVGHLSSTDLETRRGAAAMIMNMAPHPKIKERIVEAGALAPLAALLKDEDTLIKERAAGAIGNLFNDHTKNTNAGFTQAPDLIPSLVAVVQQGSAGGISDEGLRPAVHALAMLAAEDRPCEAVWSAGAGPPILKLLQDGMAEAALGVMNLSWRWPDVKTDLADQDAITHLVKMLHSQDTLAREYAAGALMNMTAGSVPNAEKAQGAVPALVEILKTESIQGAEWSAGALANITRVGSAPQQAAVDAGACKLLANLLPKASSSGRQLLVLAFISLAEHQSAAVQQALSGGAEKRHLKEYRDSGDEELRRHTNSLVSKLGSLVL